MIIAYHVTCIDIFHDQHFCVYKLKKYPPPRELTVISQIGGTAELQPLVYVCTVIRHAYLGRTTGHAEQLPCRTLQY